MVTPLLRIGQTVGADSPTRQLYPDGLPFVANEKMVCIEKIAHAGISGCLIFYNSGSHTNV